jgi:hypothetical protein
VAAIRFDIETFRNSGSGSAFGQIWLELAGQALPCPKWDDFIVFVLDWWRRGIDQVLARSDQVAYFAFMDGIYYFSVGRSADSYEFRLFQDDIEVTSGLEDKAGVKEFLTSYCVLVRAILDRTQQDGDWRRTYAESLPELDDLKADLARFESLIEDF